MRRLQAALSSIPKRSRGASGRNTSFGTEQILTCVDRKAAAFIELSDRIWAMPELRFEEVRSVEEHVRGLQGEGFSITRNVAGMPTAFVAEAGEGDVTIGFLGEFDALAGLSQEAGASRGSARRAFGR